jgi:hypothetical protein
VHGLPKIAAERRRSNSKMYKATLSGSLIVISSGTESDALIWRQLGGTEQ